MGIDQNSLGKGIGLQYKPDPYAQLFERQFARAENIKAQQSKIAAQKQKDDDDRLNAIANSDFKIDPSKYHQLYMGKVNGTLKDTFNEILQTKRNNPDNWGNLVIPKLLDLKQKLNYYQENSGRAFQIEKDVHDGKTINDPTFLKTINDPRSAEDWSRVTANPYSGTSFDAQSGQIGYDPIQRYDFNKTATGLTADANYEIDPTSTKATPVPNAKWMVGVSSKKIPKAETIYAHKQSILNDPAALGTWAYANQDKIEQAKAQGIIKDDASLTDFIRGGVGEWVDNTVNKEQWTNPDYRNIPVPKEEKKDKTIVVTPSNGAVSTIGNMYVNKKTGDTFKETKDSNGNVINAVAYGSGEGQISADQSWDFSKVLIQYSTDQHFNMQTGEAERPRGSKDYEVSAVRRLPYTIAKDGSILLVDDKIRAKNEKYGKIKTGLFALGQEAAGTVDGEQVDKPRAIPLTKSLYDLLKDKGKLKLDGFEDSQLFGSGTQVSGAPKASSPKADSLRSKYGY